MGRLVCILVVFFGVYLPDAGANGTYRPDRPPNTALDLPTIPMQTAFIRYDDGIQTLLVESTVRNLQGDRFAWVLPLPNEPTLMEPVGSFSLVTLRYAVDRMVVSRSSLIDELFFLLLNGAMISLFFIYRIFWRQLSGRSLSLIGPACLLILFNLFIICSSPRILGGGRSGGALDNVELLQRGVVGNYDISVLKATDAQQLDTWLADNQYAPIGEDGAGVVQDYVDEGWIFLAIKLRRVGVERLEPHPLKVVFPSPHPVFPMRLTAAAGQKTNMAIFTAGPVPYMHPRFRTIYRKQVHKHENDSWYSRIEPTIYVGWGITAYQNPDIVSLVQDQEWLTRLEATLTERTMREDIILRPLPEESKRVHVRVYTGDVILFHTISAGFLATFLVLPIGYALMADGKRRRAPILWAMLGIVVLTIGITAIYHERAGEYEDLGRPGRAIDSKLEELAEEQTRSLRSSE